MAGGIDRVDFHGLPAVRLTAPGGACALVTLYGAHVQSWIPASGDERLYLSERAQFQPDVPIRGGVPVVFPQFSTFGPLARHGFTRSMDWELAAQRVGADFASVTMRLADSPDSRALWPHPFALELTVSVGDDRLDLELGAENPGPTAYDFQCALHTYLRVADIETTRLYGLRGLHYRDMTHGGAERVEQQDALEIGAPVDRIYPAPATELMLREPARSLSIQSVHFTDLVVWNPWDSGSLAIADLPPTGFRRFLCVEGAVIAKPISLAPGDEWWGRQTLIALR
jgi:glucose-6-phosphate 1-epimerase